ncbi:MAG: hypothetical protein KAX38_09000, partial [Candidatus Krumholzibacteria bacterium]|nr:hypothetical protein [Candidatus Krumholzibacteria bacterium]
EKAAGEGGMELFADWSSACYLSGRGITGDERFNYSSINLREDFEPLYFSEFDLQEVQLQGDVKTMSPEFILMSVPSMSSLTVSIECESPGRMNAVIIRLY